MSRYTIIWLLKYDIWTRPDYFTLKIFSSHREICTGHKQSWKWRMHKCSPTGITHTHTHIHSLKIYTFKFDSHDCTCTTCGDGWILKMIGVLWQVSHTWQVSCVMGLVHVHTCNLVFWVRALFRAGVGLVAVGQGRKRVEQFREAVWVKAGWSIGRESPYSSGLQFREQWCQQLPHTRLRAEGGTHWGCVCWCRCVRGGNKPWLSAIISSNTWHTHLPWTSCSYLVTWQEMENRQEVASEPHWINCTSECMCRKQYHQEHIQGG